MGDFPLTPEKHLWQDIAANDNFSSHPETVLGV